MKQPVNQIREPIHPPRKPRPRQQPANQSEFVQHESATFKVTAKMQHRRQSNGNDFGIGNCNATIFTVSARLEKIVNKTVYLSLYRLSIIYFNKLVNRFILLKNDSSF
jgi:hypothetical protein